MFVLSLVYVYIHAHIFEICLFDINFYILYVQCTLKFLAGHGLVYDIVSAPN